MNFFEKYKFLYSILLFVLSVITVLPFYNFNFLFSYFSQVNFKNESSVWCTTNVNGQITCKFKNMCYDSDLKSFLFFLQKGTIIKGLHDYTDLQKIQLSSINLHSQFYANISVVSAADYKIEKIITLEKKGFLFSRFKPDNIMHVIHDDLLPLFLSLDYICTGNKNCFKSHRLIIHDNYAEGPYFYLYKFFSNEVPIILQKILPNFSKVFCWEEIRTGLFQDSIFYQYGFNKPHGPLKNPFLNINNIVQFSEFIRENLKIDDNFKSSSDVLIISRNKTRKILNVEELKQMILRSSNNQMKISKVKVLNLDLQENNIGNLIKEISHCKILVGMHGAEIILSIFLKPKTLLIELFPYAIQPEIVSFIKLLSELKGNNFLYFPWKNIHKKNSLSHPDAPILLGGIYHLDTDMRGKIMATEVVPPVKCCNDPNYLYHMYQDTKVGIEFENFFNNSLNHFQTFRDGYRQIEVTDEWFFPHVASSVDCVISKSVVKIVWNHPFNVKEKEGLRYNIYVADLTRNFTRELVTRKTYLKVQLPEELDACPQIQFWMSVTFQKNRSQSRDIMYTCICSN